MPMPRPIGPIIPHAGTHHPLPTHGPHLLTTHLALPHHVPASLLSQGVSDKTQRKGQDQGSNQPFPHHIYLLPPIQIT